MSLHVRLFHARLFGICQLKTRLCSTKAEDLCRSVETQLQVLQEVTKDLDGLHCEVTQSPLSNNVISNLLNKYSASDDTQSLSFGESLNRLVELNKDLSWKSLVHFEFEDATNGYREVSGEPNSLGWWKMNYVKPYNYTADDICLVERFPATLTPKNAFDGKWLDQLFGVDTYNSDIHCNTVDLFIQNLNRPTNDKLNWGSSLHTAVSNVTHEPNVHRLNNHCEDHKCEDCADIIRMSRNDLLSPAMEETMLFSSVTCYSDLQGSPPGPPNKMQPNKPTRDQLTLVQEAVSKNISNFFVSRQEYGMYRLNIIFVNNLVKKPYTKEGTLAYALDLLMIRIYARIRFANVRMHLMKVTTHKEEGAVRVHWRVSGIPQSRAFMFWKFLPWTYKKKRDVESEWYDGISTFHVDGEGMIYKHQMDKVIPDAGPEIAEDKGLVKKIQEVLTPKPATGTT